MNSKPIILIVTVTVAIITCATVLVPIINDAQESTYTNKDNLDSVIQARMGTTVSEDLTFEFSGTGFTYPDGTVSNAPINLIGSTFFFNYTPQTTWWYGDYYDLDSGKITGVSKIVVHPDTTVTVYTSSTEYTSAPNAELYFPQVDGNYGLVRNNSCLVSDNHEGFCSLYTTTTSIDGTSRGVLAIGYLGTAPKECLVAGIMDTTTNQFIDKSADLKMAANIVTEYNGYYGLSGRVDITGESDLGTVTSYTTFAAKIVPVTYHVDGQNTPVFKMLDAIPVMILIMVLIGVVAVIAKRPQ